MGDGTLAESSYYSAAAALRRETLRERASALWKRNRDAPWFWAVEVGFALLAAVLARDESPVRQALAAAGASIGVALVIWLSGFVAAPYLWRRDALKLLPPFEDNYARAQQRLLAIQLLEQPPDELGVGTAFEALFQIHTHLATGVTVAECARHLSRIYGDGSTPTKHDANAVLDSFLAELSMLHVVRRDGNRFYLTDFGKDFLDRNMLFMTDLVVAEDGTLSLPRGP